MRKKVPCARRAILSRRSLWPKALMSPAGRLLLAFVALPALLLPGAALRGAPTYVTKSGAFDPNGWSCNSAYMTLMAAFASFEENPFPDRFIRVGPGEYYTELEGDMIIDTPCSLKLAHSDWPFYCGQGQEAIIGSCRFQNRKRFSVLTFNAMQFGGALFGPDFCDDHRATELGHELGWWNDWGVDVVALQELWDEGYIYDGYIPPLTGYDYWYVGFQAPLFFGTGCVLFSNTALEDTIIVSLKAVCGCNGEDDCMVLKGWLQATTDLGEGFRVGLFNTHTEAGGDTLDWRIRECQVERLLRYIDIYRSSHPDNPVFLMGDFNIYCRDDDEYWDNLRLRMRDHGGREAFMNSPGYKIRGAPYQHLEQCTWLYNNPLVRCREGEIPLGDSGRIDYVIFFPSLNGNVEVMPVHAAVHELQGNSPCEDSCDPTRGDDYDLITSVLSDHSALLAEFYLIRTNAP